MNDIILLENKVTEIFMDCLFTEDEDSTNFLEVEGILVNVGFNPIKIEKHRDSIRDLTNKLNENFLIGWSFLNICFNKDNELWTSSHKVCEQLLLLGLAIGKLEYILPRDVWNILPGKLPYIRLIGDVEYNDKWSNRSKKI